MKTLKQFTSWLKEEQELSNQFSFETFSAIEDRVKAIQYLVKTKMRVIGTGSFRATFALTDSKVLKIATMIEGIEHNKREVAHSKCLGKKFAVDVYKHHPEFWWLIEERAELLDDDSFVSAFFSNLGIDKSAYPYFNDLDIQHTIEIAQSGRTVSRYRDDYVFENKLKAARHWLKVSGWFRELIEGLKQCNVGSDDFGTNNWGFRTSTGQLVIIDLGF